MSSSAFMQQVLSQALIGTEKACFDISIFPEALRQTIEQIQALAPDTEQSFLQISALLMSQDQTNTALDQNCFSIEQMEQYQHSLEQGVMASSQATKEQDNDATSEQDSKDSENSAFSRSIQDANPLIAQVKMHTGPLPLAVLNPESRPNFPQVVNSLVLQAINAEHLHAMLYWLLKKLSVYKMQLSKEILINLSKCFLEWRQDTLKIGVGRPIFSRFMLQELILKVGGDSLEYLLPLCDKNKDFLTFIDERVGTDEVDYAHLFSKVSESAAFGIFVKLRYENPALARKLLSERMKSLSPDARENMTRVMMINLSVEDEPLLRQVMLKDRSQPCREVARFLLSRFPNSDFANGCAELCAKYLSFDGHIWHLSPVKYDDELEALGIDKEYKKLAGQHQINKLLEELLKGMSWPALRALAKAEDDEVAFKHWSKFDTSPSTKSANVPIRGIIEDRLAAYGNKQSIEAYLQNPYLRDLLPLDSNDMFNYLDIDTRSKYIAQFKGRIAPRPWFVELGDDPREFKPIADQWGEAIFQHVLSYTTYRAQDLDVTFFGMFLSSNFISWCEQRISAYKSQMSVLDEQLMKLPDDAKNRKQGYELKTKQSALEAKIDLASRVLGVLQVKQNIETTLENALSTTSSTTAS